MKKILGIGNALVDALVQVKNDMILNELQLPKGSMQLVDTKRYLEIKKFWICCIRSVQQADRHATPS